MRVHEEHIDGMVLTIDDIDGNAVGTVTKLHDTAGQARAWLAEIRWAMYAAKQQGKQDGQQTAFGHKGYRSGD